MARTLSVICGIGALLLGVLTIISTRRAAYERGYAHGQADQWHEPGRPRHHIQPCA